MMEVGSLPSSFRRAAGGFQKSPTCSHARDQAGDSFLMRTSLLSVTVAHHKEKGLHMIPLYITTCFCVAKVKLKCISLYLHTRCVCVCSDLNLLFDSLTFVMT